MVLCEPTVIWPPAPAEGNKALAPYVTAVREIGVEVPGASCGAPS